MGTSEGVAEALEDPWAAGWLAEPEGAGPALEDTIPEEAWELGSAEGETEATGVPETGETEGVLIGTDTLDRDKIPQLSTSEMLVTSTLEPASSSASQSMMRKTSELAPVAVHGLEIVAHESLAVWLLVSMVTPPT